ncbi:hypothetical protein [Marinomonas sp. IMCC 4694]|uniref:hypothetical protein n=1 Tax=Marinomonas sp. IMCC 4694 TaxID=2605432 RepID=UPI0011E62DC2|nr:hypothetical protein [Marinomonas sp. IMCC 4694]TYL46761.1 hypothetical protein FXV75_01740 [Marinomonas sp. IMCC 4694]
MPTSQADTNSRPNTDAFRDSVHLSDRAKQMLTDQLKREEAKEDELGKESVQISSSIGRLSRVSGLHREEVAALYRSIDNLT